MTGIVLTNGLWKKNGGNVTPVKAGEVVRKFLDVSTTSFGRATHYNTKDEQQAAEMAVHNELFALCRDLYVALLLLPGSTDRSVQVGIKNLLANKRDCKDLFLNPSLERKVLSYLIRQLPPQRMIKLFDSFRGKGDSFGVGRVNNSRTRKLILSTLFNSDRLELWSVKYRHRLQKILTHVWGQRVYSIVADIIKKNPALTNEKEQRIMINCIFKYVTVPDKYEYVDECVGFVLGKREGLTLPLFRYFIDAKKDLKSGEKLPTEILEGIRSTYHSKVSKDEVLKLKAKSKTMTTHEKRVVQKRAKSAGVKVDMDPLKYDPVELYIYAFENGADEKVFEALDEKALVNASAVPVKYDKVGILVDASKSMEGDKTQKLRPLAVTLASRDMLMKIAKENMVVYCGGDLADDNRLVKPKGETALADGLLTLLKDNPDAVFVLSDGYENSPAGRFSDVLFAVREIGVDTPVFHLNPVFASEAASVRSLCGDAKNVTTMPIKSPSALGTTMIRGLIEADPEKGINELVKVALKVGLIELAGVKNEKIALI